MIVTRGWLAALHEFLHDATNDVARRRTAVLAQVYEAWLSTRVQGLGSTPGSPDRGAP